MLRKNHKLKRSDFDVVFKKGKILHSPLFMIRLLETDSFEDFAFSVVVSKKVAKSAILRNRNKRKAYSALRIALQETKFPHKGVIVLKKDLSQMKVGDIAKDLQKYLK